MARLLMLTKNVKNLDSMERCYKVINVQRTDGKDAKSFIDLNQALATAAIFHNTQEKSNDDYRVIEYCGNSIRVIGDNGNINK